MNKSSYIRLDKINSTAKMRAFGKYIGRDKKAKHVNTEMSDKNISLRGDANAAVDLFYKRLRDACVKMSLVKEVPEDKDKKRKRLRALGLDVVCAVPLEYFEKVPPKKWAQRTLEFLDETFGSENVLVVVMHMDERVPHVHALVIPIARKGSLSYTNLYTQDRDKEPEDMQGCRPISCSHRFFKRILKSYYSACHELNPDLSPPVPGGLFTHREIEDQRNWVASGYAAIPKLPKVNITPPLMRNIFDPQSYAKGEVMKVYEQATKVISALSAKAFLYDEQCNDIKRMEQNLRQYDEKLENRENQLLETQKRFRKLQELHQDIPVCELCRMIGLPVETTETDASIILHNGKKLVVPIPAQHQPYDVPDFEAEPSLEVLARALETPPEVLAAKLRPLIDAAAYERLVTYEARWQLRMKSPVAKNRLEKWTTMLAMAGVEDESVGRSAQLLETLHSNFGITRNAAMKLYNSKLPMACNSHGDAAIIREGDDGLDAGIMVVGSRLGEDGRLMEQHLGSFRSEPLVFNADSMEKTVIVNNAIEALSLLSIPRFSTMRVIVSGEADTKKIAEAALQQKGPVIITGYGRGRRRHRHWELRQIIEREGGKVQMLAMSDLEMGATGLETIALATQLKPSLINRLCKLLGVNSYSASVSEPAKPSVSPPAPPPAVKEVPPGQDISL